MVSGAQRTIVSMPYEQRILDLEPGWAIEQVL